MHPGPVTNTLSKIETSTARCWHQQRNKTTKPKSSAGTCAVTERDLEMQKQISQLTNTVTKLSEQIATLSTRPIPAAAPAAPRVVPAPSQQRQKPPTTTKPPPGPAPTYAQVAEKQPREFTEARSKKKARKETILPKTYPTADSLIIFSLTTPPNNRRPRTPSGQQDHHHPCRH